MGTEDGVDAGTPSIEKLMTSGERRRKRLNDQDARTSIRSDDVETSNDSDPNSFSIDIVVKSVTFEKYGVKVPFDWHKDCAASIIINQTHKIDALKRDLAGVTTINRDWIGVLESNARRSGGGEDGERRRLVMKVLTKKITMMWQVLPVVKEKLMKCKKFCGGGERSAFLGVDVSGNALYTPLERGGYSYAAVGTSEVPCCCECDKCKEDQDLRKHIKDLKDASERIEKTIKDLLSKRSIKPGSRLTSPCTPLA
ncbi:hypothetical protein HAX54_011905 [Datura stramonium]|uniref:Uncharacterized protein n=1 Tax=Datura stramonium TaxID=4076 RepID=A0ABS8TIU7_DATST|nr:hypothetical protein [Datura stramonium]